MSASNDLSFPLGIRDAVGGGGAGTVTSITATQGVETTTGSAITDSGTIRESHPVNPQTGTTYTFLNTDRGQFVVFNNAASIAATLPQAGTTGFEAGYTVYVKNNGAGAVTITPTVSNIDSAASRVLTTGMSIILFSNGTNYRAIPVNAMTPNVNLQTGTSYTVASGDSGKLNTFTNASAISVALPQATGDFAAWFGYFENRGAGTVTITPTTSTIDGAASLALTTNQGCMVFSDGTNYYTMRGIGGAGGLTNFTEAVNTSAPNATIPVVSLTPNNAASGVDIALVPKGTAGSLMAAVPNNSASGGNKRGNNAVDWQTTRSSASQVASGDDSVIAGGVNNTASGTSSACAGGSSNVSSGTQSFTAGASNTASGQGSIAAGLSNIASGTASMAIGQNNTSSGANSMVRGYTGDDYGVKFADVWSNGFRSTFGDRETMRLPLVITTSNNTATAITSDAGAASGTNQLKIGSGLSTKFTAQVVARRSDGATAGWDISGVAKNVSGTLSIVGTPTVTQQAADSGISAYTVAVVADNTNKCPQIQVTGGTGDTVYWKGMIEGEIIG